MLDLETLTQPVSVDEPCGPDLDAAGDVQYLNFFAGAEPLLPMSYFEVVKPTGERGRFDPKSIDFEAQFEAAKPLLARTRDLRLTILLAKFSILNRNLDDFIKCLKAIEFLLREHWEAVHPPGEDGDFAYRGVTIEAIDVYPTVINPLQFLPLIENRRHGMLNYRAYLVAKGEIAAGDDEADKLDLAGVERILADTDLEIIKARSDSFVELAAVVANIKTVWRDQSGSGGSLNLDKLSGIASAVSDWLKGIIKLRDPTAVVETSAESEAEAGAGDGQAPVSAADLPKMTSPAVAVAALNAAADYFARAEPSNPALLLIRQAQEMVGKSFVEVIRMMLPAYAETAAINIGRDKFFDLPIERMATLLNGSSPPPVEEGDQTVVLVAESRAQAMALLGQTANYFRVSEPSSPIPFLIDRARELAQRDFLSLLHDVLPDGALKTIEKQG